VVNQGQRGDARDEQSNVLARAIRRIVVTVIMIPLSNSVARSPRDAQTQTSVKRRK
jgi:hypothetical protein